MGPRLFCFKKEVTRQSGRSVGRERFEHVDDRKGQGYVSWEKGKSKGKGEGMVRGKGKGTYGEGKYDKGKSKG